MRCGRVRFLRVGAKYHKPFLNLRSHCKRTVSLLPEFALPYVRFGVVVIAAFLVARILFGLTLKAAAESARLATMPYQRGQLWVRRFRLQAERLCGALAALIAPPAAPDFTSRALQMLESIGWIAAHRFLLADLRVHLLGWPAFLAPNGRIARAAAGDAVRLSLNTQLLHGEGGPVDLMLWLWRSSAWMRKPRKSPYSATD
jgi:hypothetical protein